MRRFICLLLIFALCFGPLCGCGRTGEESRSGDGETEERIERQSYYPFEPGYTVCGIARQGNILLAAAERDENKSLKLFKIEDGSVKEKPCEMTIDRPDAPEKEEIKAVAAAPDGQFAVLTGEFGKQYYDRQMKLVDNPDYQGRYSISRYDAEGAFISEARFSLSFDDARGLCYDDGGTAYVYGKNYITAIDEEGKITAELEFVPDFELYSAAFSEGLLILSGFDYSSSAPVYLTGNLEDGQSLEQLNIQINAAGELYGSSAVMQPLEDEYLVCDDRRFFAYDIKSDSCEELMRWGVENQYDTVFNYVCRIGEREFIAVGARGESLICIRAETVPTEEKSIVKVAVCAEEDRWAQVQGRVEEFALANGEYEYSFAFYDGLDMSGFYTDFNSGNVPDLVLFESGLNTSSKQFEDIYDYIDADPDMDRGDFVPGLLTSLETKGELRQIWTGFRLETALARTENLAEIRKQGEWEYLSAALESGDTAIFNSASPEYIAALLTAEYIDRSGGQSLFDDESFPRFLQLWGRSADDPEKSLFFCQSVPVPMLLENILHRDGEKWELTGLPICPSGGSYFRIGAAVRGAAIPVSSGNKAGAWAYIKSELTMESQLGQEYNIHVIKSALERQAAAQLSEENCQMFLEHIAMTNRAILGGDEALYDMIKRAAAAYMDGSMTLDEAAADIRSRAGIYISEQYS